MDKIIVIGSSPARDIATWVEEMRDKPERVPTVEELLEAQYSLTPEQAQQLREIIEKTAKDMYTTFENVFNLIQNVLTDFRKSPGWQELLKMYDKPKQNYYEKPRLPSQQGYNRTPYDRWRNSLGGGRRRR